MTILVTINGEQRQMPDGATVVRSLSDDRLGRGVAVAVAGEVVPRGSWDRIELHEGANVEVVSAVQGG